MDLSSILVSVVTLTIIGLAIYYYIKTYDSGSEAENPVKSAPVGSIQDGRKSSTYSNTLPKSYNQPNGLSFSYAGWIRIDDFTYRYGAQKVIFSKGDEKAVSPCPALLVDANTNALLVKIDTFGQPEIVSVQNIPAKKWIHFAISVDQDSVNVYIDGTLASYNSLSQLPKQNQGSLYISPDGGFDGKIGLLEYYNYSLQPSDVSALAAISPVEGSSADKGIGVLPPYFDSSWFSGRD
jgi:hypothetical protein